MKNVHIVAILGGATALYFVTRSGKANAAPRQTVGPTPTDIWGKPIAQYQVRANAPGIAGGCVDRSGSLVDMKYCADPEEQLSGYFSTGDACCSNCAAGKSCSG